MIEQQDALVRVLLAAGDRELERRLSRELAAERIVVAARCLDGPSLLERAREPGIDVVLASADLHHLTESALLALRERRRPVVLLTAEGADVGRLATLARVLPASSSGAIVAAALRQAESRGAFFAASLDAEVSAGPIGSPTEDRGQVIAVTSGKGAPGKTTVAIALAALLAAEGSSVVLVDADLRGGNVAPHLDLDPRRGLVSAAASGDGLEDELQQGPGFAVLVGLERPELANGLRDETLSAIVTALRARFERVIVDLGAPPEPSLLRLADELLLVTGADLVSVWNARVGLRGLGERVGIGSLAAVVNRREGREHYGAEEIERALRVPVLGVVREDRNAARRATAKQLPLSDAGGRAARDLHRLATALESRGEPTAPQPDRVLASLVEGR